MKKLHRTEIAIVALTLAFICFTAGYFVGRANSSNVITVASQAVSAPPDSPSASPGPSEISAAPSPTQNGADGSAPPSPTPESASPSGAASGLIDINTASIDQLCDLPGIGQVLAQRIIDYRQKSGGFQSISELMNVTGIGDAKYAAIKDLITTG